MKCGPFFHDTSAAEELKRREPLNRLKEKQMFYIYTVIRFLLLFNIEASKRVIC